MCTFMKKSFLFEILSLRMAQEPMRGLAASQARCPIAFDVFGKPEKAVIQQFEALFFPENRVVLPFRFTVFQTDADRSVLGQAFLQVGHLVGENFLCSENVDVVKSDHVCGEITPVGPLVRTVRLGIDADVERHYFEFVVGRSGGGAGRTTRILPLHRVRDCES